MQQRARRTGIVLSANFLLIAMLALNTTVSLAQLRSGSGATETVSPAAWLAANYRQLMARYVRAHNRYAIRDAKISKPYERWGGLLRGGSIPTVCVAIFRDNPFGMVVRDNWVMTIEDGQVKEMELGTGSCSDLSPFTELKPR